MDVESIDSHPDDSTSTSETVQRQDNPVVSAGSVSNRLCDLRKAINLDSNLWIDVTRNDSSLRFCHLISAPHAMQNCNPFSLAFTVVIYENFTWQLYVGSHLVDNIQSFLSVQFPQCY